MNMFARFDENPTMTLQDIEKTKRYGRTQARTDNVKTVYPPQTPTTNKVCGGYKKEKQGSLKLWKHIKKNRLNEKSSFELPKHIFI